MASSARERKDRAFTLAKANTPAGGSVLEVSCGEGNELMRLQQAGLQVTGTNYTKYQKETSQIPIRHGVDILKGLPFEEGSFDTVMLLDVIEHLANHDQALAELSRVCKPGGHVIIMTPNPLKLASRLHFLTTGFLKTKRAFIGFDVPAESSFAFHNYPIHLPTFLYQMHAHGLTLHEFCASVYKAKSYILLVLLWPLIALSTWYKVHVAEKHIKGTPHASTLHRCLTSVTGLCGEFIFIIGKKSEHTGDVETRLPKWSEKWQPDGETDEPPPAT